MLRRALRLALRLGLLAGVAYAIAKVLDAQRTPAAPPVEPASAPMPVREWPKLEPDPGIEGPRPGVVLEPDPESPHTAWVEPTGDVCPTTHPVKAKLSSKIFHLPGMSMYDRTRPDRCYASATEAEADGLRPAKR